MRYIRRAAHTALRHRRILLGLVIVVTLLVAFEITARHLPPDGVIITETRQSLVTYVQTPQGARPRYTTSTTTHTHLAAASPLWRARINRLSDDLNTGAVLPLAILPSYWCQTPGGSTNYQVTFTWHSLPVQTWTTLYGCNVFMENSGGVSNFLWSHTLPYTEEQTLNALR